MHRLRMLTLVIAVGFPTHAALADMMIEVSYDYDSNNFFDTDTKKAALEAAAQRFSDVIDSALAAVAPGATETGTPLGWRIGFTHPGNGASWQLSTAASVATDPFSTAANEYGFAGLEANKWILYAGGRALGTTAGVGGTGTGTNATTTFDDFNGPMHRGLIPVSAINSVNDLPTWGGSISFNNDGTTNWHFDPNTPAPAGTTDFYTIALHEIGHALGLNTSWNQWANNVVGATFNGSEAVAAFNADNGTSVATLALEAVDNPHWDDGTQDAEIFPAGNPNLAGTVGLGVSQDLLMEPTANFTGVIKRFELTNVDVAALRDVGWSTVAIPEPSAFLFVGLSLTLVALRRWQI